MNYNKVILDSKTALFTVLGVMTVLSLRQIENSSLGYPDADRILMDGVFLLDFMRDFPITHIYDYTINYFGQYPALSIGYRPPFFPFVEAIFNGIFGINMWSSRLALLAFYLVGIVAWFKLISRIFDWQTAFAATLVLVTTPFIAKWGWYTMAELPVLSMGLLAGYLFYRYTETDNPSYLYSTAVVFSLACWTKQTAVFLVLWFAIFSLMQGNLLNYVKRKEFWISTAIVLITLMPLAAITLWLGKQNLAQSLGENEGHYHLARLSWDNLTLHFVKLKQYHLTLPLLIMSIAGAIAALIQKDRKILYPLALLLGTYLFFTYLVGKNERYPIFWIPVFCLFAVLPLYYLKHKVAGYMLMSAAILGLVVFQTYKIYNQPPNYATGYDEAAQFVLDNQQLPTVFVDAYNNGYFTYFMRALDEEKSTYVLRADKLLTSSSIFPDNWLDVHAHSVSDINKLLDEYGIDLIVIENRDVSGIEIHKKFREYLKKGPFKLLKTIDVESSRPVLQNQQLLIYRYLNRKPATENYLQLRLPVVGQTIKVPIKKNRRKEQAESRSVE
ncbi:MULTISPECIES: ArnT family glycosyltransferase [Methylobacter]|uniref:ArnT family glycosyltransferase n=1 Tax=Methylobacter TaxID=429 RepID=UPI00035E5CF8|nr:MULTISPECIES: glycosyltransferase family 39 protein [Methylobacter]